MDVIQLSSINIPKVSWVLGKITDVKSSIDSRRPLCKQLLQKFNVLCAPDPQSTNLIVILSTSTSILTLFTFPKSSKINEIKKQIKSEHPDIDYQTNEDYKEEVPRIFLEAVLMSFISTEMSNHNWFKIGEGQQYILGNFLDESNGQDFTLVDAEIHLSGTDKLSLTFRNVELSRIRHFQTSKYLPENQSSKNLFDDENPLIVQILPFMERVVVCKIQRTPIGIEDPKSYWEHMYGYKLKEINSFLTVKSYEGNVHTIPSCCAFASNAILPFKRNVENVIKEFKEFLENLKSPLNKESLFHFTETTKYKNAEWNKGTKVEEEIVKEEAKEEEPKKEEKPKETKRVVFDNKKKNLGMRKPAPINMEEMKAKDANKRKSEKSTVNSKKRKQ